MQVRILITFSLISALMLTGAHGAAPPASTAPTQSTKLQAANTPKANNAATPNMQRLALLLPLSGKQQAAGIAVRDGFLTAALQKPVAQRGALEIFDTNEAGVIEAYAQARRAGATVVVGPLLKEDIDTLVKKDALSMNTIALNTTAIDAEIPANLIAQFPLDPEDEARQVVQRAVTEQQLRAIIITPKNEWGQRIQRAFTTELSSRGGSVTEFLNYDPGASDHVTAIKSIMAAHKPSNSTATSSSSKGADSIRNDFDFIFIAATSIQAKQIYPAVRYALSNLNTPIYATSDSYALEGNNNELEGLRFIEMPWVINRDQDTAALYNQMERSWGNALRSRSRLYALGIDAFRLCEQLGKSHAPNSLLRGVTGLLTLDPMKHIHRQLDWAQIVNGSPQLIPSNAQTH